MGQKFWKLQVRIITDLENSLPTTFHTVLASFLDYQYPWQLFASGKRQLVPGFTGTPIYIDSLWLGAFEDNEPTVTVADKKNFVRGLLDFLMQTGHGPAALNALNAKRQEIMLSEGTSECSVANAIGSGFMEHFRCKFYVRYIFIRNKLSTTF